MKKIEDILALCIKDIKSGSSNLSDCLDRYAYIRRELEPLLRIALSIQEPPPVQLSNAFRVRARVQLMEQIHALKSESKSRRYFFGSGIRQTWYAGLLKTVAIIAAIAIAVSALGAGTAYASQDSLPGNTLYPVKMGTEQFRRLLTTDDAARVELELTFASIRLQEIEVLANKGTDRITMAANRYEQAIAMAIERAEQTGERDVSVNVLEMVALAISNHLSILDRIEDGVPENSKKVIKHAKEIAITEQIRALRSLALNNPVRAAEINIDTMQSRLNRAKAKADEGQLVAVEDALQQFKELRRFGDELSQIAKGLGYGATAIDDLHRRATPAQMEVLDAIYGRLSKETIAAIEDAMGIPIGGHGKEGEESQDKGTPDDASEKPDGASEKPGDDSEEHGNGSGEPGNSSEEPGNDPGEPGNGSGEPGDSPGKPGNGKT